MTCPDGWLVGWLVGWFVRWFGGSLVQLFVRSLVCSSVRSFVCVEKPVHLCNVQEKNTDSVWFMRVQNDVIGDLSC